MSGSVDLKMYTPRPKTIFGGPPECSGKSLYKTNTKIDSLIFYNIKVTHVRCGKHDDSLIS